MEAPYIQYSGKSFYDIAAPSNSPFPSEYFLGLLSQSWVQSDLGVAVNYTESSTAVFEAFDQVGDYVRGGAIEDLGYILESGVKVALIYGDRDFACPWIGGENVSLHIPWTGQANFQESGYTGIQVNESYVGGQVRQYGNLSFARVYEAGHEVPAYQPETAYEIFRRVMNNLDVATGQVTTGPALTLRTYSSDGISSTWGIKNEIPAPVTPECYILSPPTCTEEELSKVVTGDAFIKDYIVVNDVNNASSTSVPNPNATSKPKTSTGSNNLPTKSAVYAVVGGVLTTSLLHFHDSMLS
jgi:Serine carboxypeptidase